MITKPNLRKGIDLFTLSCVAYSLINLLVSKKFPNESVIYSLFVINGIKYILFPREEADEINHYMSNHPNPIKGAGGKTDKNEMLFWGWLLLGFGFLGLFSILRLSIQKNPSKVKAESNYIQNEPDTP